MNTKQLASVLAIAGTDPSGGAGISADIKTISATGAYATAVITALVAQNTQGVRAIESISASFIAKQLHAVLTDIEIKTIKIGMLHDKTVIDVVCEVLAQYPSRPIVVDPVMIAKDGSPLLKSETLSHLKAKLLGRCHLITPNRHEVEYLLGKNIRNEQEMQTAAITLGREFRCHALVKGGHFASNNSSDVLYHHQEDNCHWFHAQRIHTKNTHGTGCTLSSAIASYLAQGLSIVAAINTAKDYLSQAIAAGQHYHLGKGNGPVDHFYFLVNRLHRNSCPLNLLNVQHISTMALILHCLITEDV